MTSTTLTKLLVFNGVDWVTFELKFRASLSKSKLLWTLLIAPKNSDADRALGAVLKTAYLAQFEEGLRDAKEAEAQVDIHSQLVLSCIDSLQTLVAGVSATSDECGTTLWNRLL